MKITGAKTRALSAPEENPLIVGKDPGGIREYVSLELSTDEGITGLGISFFGWKLTPALKTAVDIMAELVIGDDPMQPEAVTGKIRESGSGSGPGGIFTLALSAIDIALWDIKGKALNQPVYKLLGGYRDRAPTYASGALGRPFNVEYLAEAGPRLASMGFKQMKTQLGAEPTVAREIERIRVLRDAIGDDIDLMCDVNQLWSVNQAIGIGRQLEEYHLFWLEDVVAHDDYQGFARVADALTTPIARGRVRVRHQALQAHAGTQVYRHRHGGHGPSRGRDPVHEDCGNGRSIQPARGQPPDTGIPSAHYMRHPQRADG